MEREDDASVTSSSRGEGKKGEVGLRGGRGVEREDGATVTSSSPLH